MEGPFNTQMFLCRDHDVCIRKDLNTHVVLSGCTGISFMNCQACIRKELNAECCVVGGTAVFRRMTRSRTIRH